MAHTKISNSTNAIIDNWASIAADTFRVGATKDIASFYEAMLQIEICSITANLWSGANLIVEVSFANELFVPLLPALVVPSYTATVGNLEAGVTADDSTIDLTVASFTNGERALIWESGTPANSESVLFVSNQASAVSGQEYTLASNAKYGHAVNMSVCEMGYQNLIKLPNEATAVRTIVQNLDSSDAAQARQEYLGQLL